jgi:uncharacterized membrane protein YhiD involved in acid resistance
LNFNQLWEILDGSQATRGSFAPENIVLSILLAFLLGQVLAWVYYFTHTGLSYSRTFVQSLVMVTVVVALVMTIIGNNITRAFGLMGAMSIIRFRNVIKDTRDMLFIFCGLAIGMAAGTQNYTIAIIGTVALSLTNVYLYISRFGTHKPHNGFIRFTFPAHIESGHPVIGVLKKFCTNFTLISVQDTGAAPPQIEYAYQLMIRNSDKNEQMISELEKIAGIANINLTMQEVLLEV